VGPIDSHCHLQSLRPEEIEPALDAAREAGVRGFLVPAIQLEQADELLELCSRHADVWCSLGTHPHDASTWGDGHAALLESYLGEPKVVAVGECGLDFYYDHSPREKQLAAMREQWDVATGHGLPVIVHNRDSNQLMLETALLPEYRDLVADFHSFAGGAEMAQALLGRPSYFGLSGMITFPKADNVREILPLVPKGRLLVETDTPYLAPIPYRGKPNRPAYVTYVLERLAAELGLSGAEAGELTCANFFRLFPKAAA
jgi:TatD DNase family protein